MQGGAKADGAIGGDARPAIRMLCTECLELGEPDTVLEGSDRIELAAWCLLALPGLFYCAWRHATRFKVCSRCGSDALMRECRAAVARRQPEARRAGGSRVRSLSSLAIAWPRPFDSTRLRLRCGAIAALFVLLAGCSGLMGVLDLAPPLQASQAALASGLLCALWLFHQLQHSRLRCGGAICGAWDADGRALRIEQV